MRWEVGRGQTTKGCVWLGCLELFFWVRELLACFNFLLHPTSHIDPLKSLSSGLMGYKELHFFVKAAAMKLTFHTLANRNVLLVKLIHGYQAFWPKVLMKQNEQDCWTLYRTCDKPHTTSLFPEACVKTDA